MITTKNLCKSYRKKQVLDNIEINIQEGKIYGLIGRSGAGKTTLLSLLSAQKPSSLGKIEYRGENLWENERVLENIFFSKEFNTSNVYGENHFKVKNYLQASKYFCKYWDEEYALRMMEEFSICKKEKISTMNTGRKSLLTILLALASRAPITMLDEPVAGLDVPMRERFYQLLLDDYEKTGRTFIISTHIIDEAAPVFEKILLLDQGKIIENCDTEEFTNQFYRISGHEDQIKKAIAELEVLQTDSIGRQVTVYVRSHGKSIEKIPGLEYKSMSLSEAFVYATGGNKGGIIA